MVPWSCARLSINGNKIPIGLLFLDLSSAAVALISALVIGRSGGSILGVQCTLLYVAFGLCAIACSAVGATWSGVRLSRAARLELHGGPPNSSVELQPPQATAASSSSQQGINGITAPGGLQLDLPLLEEASDGHAVVAEPAPRSGSDLQNVENCLATLDIKRAKRLAQLDHAVSVRRRVFFVAAYVSITVLSFGLGIEAVNLSSGRGSPPAGVELTALAAAIAALQATFFLTKRFVARMLAMPEISLQLRAVHVHSLHLTVDAFDHSCDICGKEIESGECFQCKLCDFDYCLVCIKKGNKLQDWGLLRGDKGVKVPERVRQASMATFFCRALGLLRPYKLHVTITGICLSFNVICRLLVPNLEGGIFDDLVEKDSNSFMTRIWWLVIFWLGQTMASSAQHLAARLMSRQLRLDLRLHLFEQLLAQDIAFFDATRAGAMSQRIDGDVEDVSRPVPILVNNLLQSAIMIVGAVTCCLIASQRLTVLASACMGPIAYLTHASAAWSSGLNNQMTACEEEGNAIVTEAMTNIRNVRAFSAERHETRRYSRVLGRLARKMKREAIGDLVVENLEGSLEFLVEVLVLLFGGMAIAGGHEEALSIGTLIAFTMYWDLLRQGVEAIQDVFSDLAQAAGAAQRVFDLMDIKPDIPLEDGFEFHREAFRGHVCFEQVHFSYQSRPDKSIFRGLELEIPAGGTCALVGRSGVGKSTLMHLLLRFYDPQGGRIMIDGIDLARTNLRTLHSLTGLVSQETHLHFGSIRENLIYGLPWETLGDGELEQACTAANCTEFISEMEDGYDSKVGEGGVRLSGGQRQRLAIARAFLRRPKLLILDEATSHLDIENEQLVQAAIDALMDGTSCTEGTGCTVILIAHRLSTVRSANIIAVLSDGLVEEQGTHHELVLKDGIYARLVAKQAERAANLLPEDARKGPRRRGGCRTSSSASSSCSASQNHSSGSSSSNGTSESSSCSSSSSSSSTEPKENSQPEDRPKRRPKGKNPGLLAKAKAKRLRKRMATKAKAKPSGVEAAGISTIETTSKTGA